MEFERRVLNQEIRLETPEDTPHEFRIRGYAAVFNRQSENLGGFIEVLKPGAFSQAIESSDVRALINHTNNLILGRTSAGTLSLFEDDTGLGYAINPPNTSYANDLIESLARGDITQSSFGFTVAKDHWDPPTEESRGLPVRVITEIDSLFDVSPVTYPAYPQTSVSVRQWVRNYAASCEDTIAESGPIVRRQHARNKINLLRLKG